VLKCELKCETPNTHIDLLLKYIMQKLSDSIKSIMTLKPTVLNQC